VFIELVLLAKAASAPNLIDAGRAIPAAIVDMRYAGENNFVGKRIDGYKRAKCLLTPPAAEALARVSDDLDAMGLKLRIFDCYRPQRAVDHFMRWAANSDQTAKAEYFPTIEKSRLFAEGYIAERSGHSRGSTIDLTIDGLDMGGPYDFFDPLSNTADPRPSDGQRANRLLLKLVMEKHGFRPYALEWWHFTLADEPYPETYFDRQVK
jgi:D-alanyl-D-alanine dipeptidase